MKRLIFSLGGSALALCSTAGLAKDAIAAQGEAQLANLLHGRVAGTAVSCVETPYRLSDGGLQVIDGVGVIYDAGKTIYVARATDPAMLRWTDRLDVTRAVSTRLCVSDRMWSRDKTTGAQTGVVFLKDFVPYTKAN